MDPIQVALRTAMEPHMAPERPLHQRALRRVVFRNVFGDMRLFRLLVRSMNLYQRSGLQWAVRRSGVLRLLRLAETEALLPPGAGHHDRLAFVSPHQSASVVMNSGCRRAARAGSSASNRFSASPICWRSTGHTSGQKV